ncbi:uncharacterized protein LOC123312761 isoform X3 [Coccinella septempunctata]|uniref:uncharacterized protein LOC123312761 isoform X3 n=1 Tax=Coccinella septempunctata TaxID=41139 RepID=UPI001D08EF36|nr:uncharacterized protein LOC123312761 isoform X3 [Coccinella septempunctata]
MRSKEKVPTRNEILKNFTREFLLEEKRRCEIDRYVTDFRILIHKSPHENHNYLNRLLQDYTTMFLSHERISANKMNQEGVKYQLKSQLASRKKDSPKQRYVKSKLSEKNDSNSEHQSYLVLRAKTEDFVKKLRQYEELEQIAYEIFIQNLNSEIKTNQYEIKEVIEPNNVLKLKSTDVPIEKPHKKHHKNVYVVNSPEGHGEHSGKHSTNRTVTNSEKQNYEHLKRETEKFLANNRDYNDAEQKMLSEQYKKNAYIKKYVDNLTSSEKSKKGPQTPKRGIYSKIKSMIGISPENPTKFYKNVEDNSETLVDSTKAFLRNEKKYNNFEFEAYKLFYIKNGDFQNPLLEKIKLIAYDSARDTSENGNKSKIKHLVGLKSANSNQRSSVKEEFEDFNTVKCSPTEKNEPDSKMKELQILTTENHPNVPSKSSNEEEKRLRENTNHFLNKMKVYEDQQRYFFVIHLRKHHINPVKEKKETLFIKIKHLFFGRHEKSKEKSNYFKEITQEFLRNEQYYYSLQTQAFRIFSKDESYYQPITLRNPEKIMKNERSISLDAGKSFKVHESRQEAVKEIEKSMKKETAEKSATLKKRQKPNKTQSSLHQRSKSEDLLMLKTRSKSLDSKKSPTGHKTFSDRLKSMVGIGNRRKTRSRENISRLTDPVHYFLEHERFYYNGTPITDGKYSRSFSALENTTKDGTIKTRTKKFISTENVLYQDSNNSLAGKPPSGRRRKQERNRDDKEKRRSRTLSPAQKLVSKIRNFVQKSSPDKTKTDLKGDNHGLQEPSADIHQNVLEIPNSQRDNAIVNIEMDSPQSPTSVKSIEIEEDGVKASKQMDKKKQKTSIPNEKYNINTEKSKKPKDLNNILDDPEHIKNQTRLFLHDIKRYHDIDKEPNAIDKTLIFINNKSDDNYPKDKEMKSKQGSSSEVLKTVQLKSINKDGKNEAVLETFSENYRENQKRVENSTNIDTTENSSRKIIHNSFVKETKIIQKVTTHRVHQKSTNKIISHESKTTRTKEDKPLAKEHIYENISISGTNQISGGSLTSNQESIKHTTTEAIPNQYHIHEVPLSLGMDLTQVEVKQSSAPTETEKSTMKETRPKTTTLPKSSPEMNKPMAVSRPQSSVQKTGHKADEADNEKNKVGRPSKTATGQNIELLRQSPSKLSGDKGKHQEKHKESSEKYTAVKLGEENFKPTTTRKSQSEMIKPVVLSEEEQMRLNKRNTDIFLKEHQDYHNKQRNEDNFFLKKVAKPENLIWLSSRPTKKTEYTTTEVKTSIPSQLTNRKLPTDDLSSIKKQTHEFLEKHQYLIHTEEVDFTERIDRSNVDKGKITVETTEQQTSAPKRIEKSPKKEEKSKKNTFSKLRSFVSGSSKKQAEDESNALLRKQTSEFLDDMRKHHDKHKEVSDKFKVVWLSQQNLKPTISQKSKSDMIKPIVLTEQQKEQLRLIRQNTDIFLKDHQDYHNKQRNEDNVFFENMGKPENMIWLSSRPAKKKENIITKVKNLMSPQQPKKTIPPSETINNKMIREQSDEFLKKHQYLIHREEVDFTKKIVPFDVEKQKITVETTEQQTSAPKRIEKSPEKEEKSKKNTFSKLRSFVSGSSKKQAEDESNALLRKQTSEFLDDMRKHHDKHKEVSDKFKVVWLSQQNLKPTISQKSKSDMIKPIVLTEQQKEQLRLIRQNTDIFLKDHQDYHNKQRNEDNVFFENMGKPENMIWLSSRPAKKKENIITKVKNLMSPQQPKKTIPPSETINNKMIREQSDEFLKKHQYLIHREEVDFTKKIVPFDVEKQKITVETTEQQTSAPKRIEKSPEKEEKSKKNTFSKLRSFVSGSSKKQAEDESNALLRKQTSEFLDDMRKHHDKHKEVSDKFKVVWLSQQNLKPTISQKSKSDMIKPIVLTEQQKEQLRLIRKNTDIFLKDHQDYHNKQRNEDNVFFENMGKPENMIWLSSRPAKKKENIITKVKNLMSPQQPKKTIPPSETINNKMIREQSDEFLKKHQYLIHREEVDFTKKIVPFDVEKQKITVETTEQQTSAPKRIEKSPEKEEKSKKNTFSKLRSFVSGSSKKQAEDESNALLRKQTSEFLDDMRKHHDKHKEVSDKFKVVWLSQQNLKPTISQKSKSDVVKPIVLTEQQKEEMRLLRQNTDIFLKDHQDYHNKQRNEDNVFFENMGKPENMIWLSSRPAKKKENIITKVKNLMSPQQPKKTIPPSETINNKMIREQSDEFLKKHQYLIHREEVDFTKKIVPFDVEKQKITVETTEQQTSAPKRIEKSPEKEEKSKKNTFSKLRSFVSGSSKKQAEDESNALLRKQTSEFLDDMRKHHDKHKEVSDKFKVVWLSQQNLKPTISQKSKSDMVKPIVLTEQQKEEMRLLRKNTDIFLKDHQDYHNKQRNEDNVFFEIMGKPEHMIWLSSRPAKKKENIITKVKNLMSPQQPKKTIPPSETINNKMIREQSDEFLKKHQYLIHKEEVDFTKTIVPFDVEKQKITVETTEQQTSAPKRIEKSPEKEEKSRKNTFSKLRSFVSGSSKKQAEDESNALLRKRTSEFLDDMRKHHDKHKEVSDKFKVVWLSQQNLKPTISQKSKSDVVKPIVLTEQQKEEMRLLRQNTDIFLKDHQDYHNKQRNEDNVFFENMGKPENMIWLSSRPAKKKENIITKVKNLMSPQQPKKTIPPSETINNKMIREQSDEFLKKHQYLIHREEVDFTKKIVPFDVEKQKITVETTEQQTSAPKRIEKSPEKEEKSKKNTFSKLRSFVSGSSKKQAEDESNALLRKQTSEFLDDMRKHHDKHKEVSDKFKVVWLSQQNLKPTISQKSKSDMVKPIVLTEQQKEEMRLLRKNTDIFLKDHQDYHNKQRNEDNVFFEIMGKPEHMIWLSSRPAKKKENIITKVKNLMSPQQPKKTIPSSETINNKMIREQSDEFLKKHQYLIHKEEVDFTKTIVPFDVEKQKITVETTEQQTSAPKRIEKSPEKEEKSKKNTFSKLRSFVSGSSKKQAEDESNALLRKQTSEFLHDMRKHHDKHKEVSDKFKVVWLSQQNLKPTISQKSKSDVVKPIVLTEQQKEEMRLLRQNTDIFLKDHQDYHNKQRNEDNVFFEIMGKPEHMIWLSSRPAKKKENIITKVKNLMSPQQPKKTIPPSETINNKMIREQSDEFLKKHQYLIHKEEVDFTKTIVPFDVEKQKITVETTEQQTSAPKRIEKSPEKEEKSKKNTFSKLRSFVSGSSKKQAEDESNALLRKQTSEFLDDMRKHHDKHKEVSDKFKVVWLSQQNLKPTISQKSKYDVVKPIVLTEQQKEEMRLLRQNTDIFLKDHQDYHNKQRNEDNVFFEIMGKPEHMIWLSSRPAKKKENIITKVKNLMSPQQPKKTIPPSETINNKMIREQSDEFLKKHQYLIHKEEVDFTKTIVPFDVEKQKITVETTEQQTSAPKRIEKSPEKEEKSKKNTFSKLRSFVSGSSKKQAEDESNALLRKQTSEFLDDMRKHHDKHKEVSDKFKVVWLSQQNLKPTISQKSKSDMIKPIVLTEQQKEQLRLIRQNTDIFLKDHQDYHNKQRNEDNVFFENMGKPENMIWLSSRPAKKKENIITKVKNLMSPQQPKKTIPPSETINNKMIREQSDEFLKKHQYLIHREEVDFTKKIVPFDVEKQKITVETTEQQTSAPKRIEKSPEKEEKSKKNTFSKLRSFVSGSSKKQAEDESNALLRKQTSEFLDDMRKHHDKHKEVSDKFKVVWLSQQNLKPTISQKSKSDVIKPIVLTEQQKEQLRLIRKNTDIFLKDHQDYHNKQRNEDNVFFENMGKPENMIWLSSRPAKKKENIITKVKNLMSPQQPKKTIPPSETINNKMIREQSDEFLKKHQYLIHREEVDFTKKIVPFDVEKQKITVETTEQQTSAPKRIEKSPEKSKKNTFSKLRSFVSGSSKKQAEDESNALLRKQTSEFLDDMRKHHDKHKEVSDKFKVVWLSQQNLKPTISQKSKSDMIKPIVLTEQQKEQLRLIRQNTDIFLKDHQDYHNKQRNEDNVFFENMGKPENMIWLSSRPAKKKENIITKVKNLMSPQQPKKTIPPSETINNKMIREQSDEFLKKHQYLIHREEVDFTKKIVPFDVEKQKITVETTEQQTSAPKRIEKSPEKEEKSKKNTFSKLRSFVSGSSKKQAEDESNALLRKQTSEFLDDMRKHHDKHKEVSDKFKVVWLSQQNLKPTISQKSKSDMIKPIVLTEQQKEQLRLIRKNTDIFLKDHQDYHNKQRNEDNVFFENMGKPENMIWLSSRPAKKKENIITKVKNLMSPQQPKKTIPPSETINNKMIREQSDEFLKKHQYLIHREEVDFTKKIVPFDVEKQKITVETTEQQTSAPKRIEKSPEKEEKSKKNTFSKLRSFVSGSSKKQAEDESNALLRKQTSEFLDDMRKHHDKHKEVSDKFKVVWLSQQNLKPTISQKSKSDVVKPIVLTEQQKEEMRLLRQNTDIFLKDHQDYHNKQRNEDNVFFENMGKPENMIWLSSRPAKKKENIITKVKNLMSPQQPKKTIPPSETINNKMIREQSDEFLKKHQYLIHREEVDFTKKIVPFDVEKQKITVETTEQQTSAPKRIEKSPEKEEKSKKNTFSKLRSFVSGSSKKQAEDESNALLRKQTSEFLDDMRKHHDKHKEVSDKFKVVWLSQQNLKPTISQKSKSDMVKPIVLTEQQKEEMRLLRKNTDIFLKDHQDYHNKQRNEDNVFFEIMGKPEHMIWLSSRPAKKKENIITKVKNLMSPQQPKKTIPPSETINNKMIREQSDEFLKKHQYLIHKEEVDFTKTIVPFDVEKQKITVETTEQQTSAPKRIEKSPEKEEKSRKNTFSKLRSFVSGSSKKQAEDESNALLRKRTSEFLDDMRKHHDKHKEVSDKFKVVWLSQQNLKPTISQKSKSDVVKPIVLTEQQKEEMRLLRQNTDIFLKDHQDYHNKQRNEDNVFFENMGKPENMIWLSSRPAKKKENIITKVKNLMSPQQPKKTIPPSETINNKMIREQSDEFLKKHQYLIHREEVDFTKKIVPFDVEKQKITVETTEQQTSAPKRIEKSPEKEEKSKKNTFSKLRSFVSGSSKKQAEDESNALLRKQTSEFLDDMRKHHDKHKEVSDKFKVVWLSQQNLKPTISQKSKSDMVKPIVLTEQQKEEMRLLRKNTDIFLKDHQDYHNKQRNEDNVFFEIMGKPEHMIWLSSRPAKKKENIITKVKNLMSPQQPKKTIPPSETINNKMIREQSDEFLKKHQYLIHREEVDFTKKIVPFDVEKQKITVETTEQQTSAPKRIEKSPEKEEKSKKNTFSKLRSFVSGSSKKQAEDESNALLRKQTSEFLDDMRKHHDKHKEVSDKFKVVWLSQQNLKPTISQKSKSDMVKPIVLTEQQKEEMRLLRKNTDIFLKDHQDYHNKQRNEDNVFFEIMGKPEHMIWLSSRPAKKKENIITKVKNLMSPQQPKKTIPPSETINNKMIREQSDEFLKKHQYLIHKEEVDFTKTIVPFDVEKQKITVETTEQQTSAPKRIEKSPEKEEKSRKNTFSKLRSFVSGSSKKQAEDESNALLRKRTSEFLDDMRKHHDKHKEVSDKFKVVWLSQQNLKPTISQKSKSDVVKPIVLTEQQKEEMRLLRQNTDIFLKDHQDYHNKQRNEDNVFFENMGKPENMIWLSSRPAKKKENIITKVKNLMSPQQPKKTIPPSETINNKMIREQSDEFLKKHQYLIHREEVDFTKKIVPFDVEKQKITVETTEQQTSAPKRIEKSPEKEEKSKKNTFSKLRSFVSGSSKKQAEDESNALLRKQTSEFLDDMRKHHDKHKEVSDKFKVVWLSQQNLKPTISQKSKSDMVKPIVLTEQQKEEMRLLRKNTDIFLKDHQDYHNKQRNEDNVFFEIMGKPEHMIWLSSRPAKKKENIITKVKNLMSPQQPKKTIPSSETINNKMIREQSDEFLKKHQYLIHKEEVDFTKTIVPFDVEKQKITVETTEQQTSAPKRIEKSPEKEEKSKKNTFSKLRSFVSGSSKKQAEDESNALLRKQTSEFLHDMRKHHDKHKEVSDKFIVVWLSQQNLKPTISQKSKSDVVKPIVLTEQQKEEMRLLRQNTDIFLKDHQDYHNKQRNEDNVFFEIMGKPEHMIWLSSRPAKKKENIITKVKNLMSPQQPKKTIPPSETINNKMIREQSDEFLKKHQYLIHKEEVDFTKTIVPFDVEKQKITVETTEQQTSAPKRIEKSPEKEEKSKKNTFSKLRSFVSGSSKKQAEDESNALLRKQTSEFLDDMRKHHDKHKEVSDKFKVVWLSQQNLKPTISQKSKYDVVKPIVLTEQQKEEMRLLRQNTDIFLKDHQDYHNKQRNEDNVFFEIMGKPEHMIWLSSRPAKKKENIITKVKNLMSPQQPKKTIPPSETINNKMIREQSDEFLKKHQYLIHKEEVDFTKTIVPFDVEKQKITVETTEQQTSAPKRIEKSPEKEEKSRKNTFSKLRSFVSGSSKKQAEDESNALLRKRTSEFLDDMRKHHDKHKEVSDKFKVVWLSQQNLKPTISQKSKSDVVKPIVLTEQQKEEMRLLRQNTDIFLKDHQDYHNKQRNEDNVFFEIMAKPEHMIWLSSRPAKKKENIITKVKNLMSPQQPKKTIPPSETINNKMIREQSDEFLKKHQYLIHKEEVDFTKTIVPFDVEKQKITVETTEQQTSAPKRIEKSPEKEEKSKKNTFSKLRSFVSGSSKKQAEDESNAFLRKQTSEFLDDIRKHHDFSEESMDVVWLSDQNIKSTKSLSSKSKPTKPISQNTDILFRDHQEGPNKQINKNTTPSMAESPCDEEADSFKNLKSADNEHPSQPRKNIISKIKDVISPNKSDQTAIFYYDIDCETKEAGHLKEKPIQSSNSEELFHIEPPEYQEGNPLSADLNPAPRLKKKVTFSYTDHPETLSIVEHQKDPSDTCHHIETPSVPEVPIEAGKPRAAPRKQVAKKVKAIYIDSAEIFKQNKERFLIEETEKFIEDHKIHQKQQWSKIQNFANDKETQGALSEPKTIQRTKENVTKSPVISQQTPSARKAFIEERRNLMLFLDDHQAYHNKERSNHINYISKQNKPYTNDLKSSTKEAKMKTKLMSKLKSLVGQSQEIIASDRKHEIENANLRKQTSEFLISQKCYNDLEGVACKKFDMKQLEKEELSRNHLKGEDSVEASSDQVASHSYSTLKKDSTFCYPGKLSVDGCPESSTKSQKPLRSSPAKKISKTENITLKETDSHINHKQGGSNEDSSTNHLITIEQTKNFLNIQRNHINSENEIWKHYLKFKPVPDPGKSHIVQKKIGKSHSKVQHRMQKPESSARKLSSQLENEKIDHEVILHKTQLFLEDQKSFHDNLQKESSKYITKNATQNIIEEKFQREEGSASSKIEPSPVLRSTSYHSSNVRKPEISVEKHEENVKIPKSNNSNDEYLKMPSTMKEGEIKEITKNFLKDHQDYHNSERVQSDNTCKEIQKQKKSKRGVISKIKSLVTGDSHKKHSSKPTMLPSTKPQDEMGTPTKKEDIIIRELESSPATYRKHKPHSSVNEETLKNTGDDSRKISDQKDSESSKSSDLVSQNDNLDKGSSEKLTVATHGEVIGAVGREDILSRNLYYNQVKGLPEEERKKYAFAKLKTQEFLLNQKEFSNILKSEQEQEISPKSGEIIPQSENKYNSQPNVALEQQLVTRKIGSEDFIKEGIGLLPSAPTLEQMDQREVENTETVIHRVVKPLSPTKTIFQEIRKREESPDRQVYIMKEGYMITKENKENVKLDKNERMENLERRRMFTSIEERSQKEEYQDHSSKNPVFEEISKEGSGKVSSVHSDGSPPVQTTDSTEGQDYVDRSIDSPSRSVPPQGDLEVRRYRTKKRTLADMEQGPATIVTETRIERGSNGEKKYITSCFLNKVSTPVWYTESLLLDLEEKTKKTDVKVFYDDLYEPYRWQESFNTDLTSKNTYVTEVHIPVNEQSDGIHYISLENQQLKGQDMDQEN